MNKAEEGSERNFADLLLDKQTKIKMTTALGVPRRSPIQVLTKLNVA